MNRFSTEFLRKSNLITVSFHLYSISRLSSLDQKRRKRISSKIRKWEWNCLRSKKRLQSHWTVLYQVHETLFKGEFMDKVLLFILFLPFSSFLVECASAQTHSQFQTSWQNYFSFKSLAFEYLFSCSPYTLLLLLLTLLLRK